MNSQIATLGPIGQMAIKQAAAAMAAFDNQVLAPANPLVAATQLMQPMHPEQIKAEMRMAGVTPAMLCDELGVARSSVSQTISGHIKSARIQQRIAQIIGKPVASIWPNQVILRRTRAQLVAARQGVTA